MAAFLDKSKWKVSTIGFSSEIEKSIVESVLFLFSQGSAVVVASVDKKEDPKDILLDDFIITDNHAYSVTHFNPELHTISLVNPWDSHCTKEIPLEVFFTLFSRVSFAYRI